VRLDVVKHSTHVVVNNNPEVLMRQVPVSRIAEHALGGIHDVIKFLGNSKRHAQTSGTGVGVRTKDLHLLTLAATDGTDVVFKYGLNMIPGDISSLPLVIIDQAPKLDQSLAFENLDHN
jgi:hypothetical protein